MHATKNDLPELKRLPLGRVDIPLSRKSEEKGFIEGLGGLTYSHICECYPINENLVWCRVSSRCLRCS